MKIAKLAVTAFIAVITAPSLVVCADDHDWVTFEGGKKAEWQYDTLSVERSRAGFARAWVRTTGDKDRLIEFEQKRSGGGIVDGFKARSKYSDYSHTLSHWEVNCALRTGAIGQTVEYDRKGNVIEATSGSSVHTSIVPETVLESFYRRLC